jgi:glucan phosphoethanolaminetransferase (alkaline phosphatase superfamily)
MANSNWKMAIAAVLIAFLLIIDLAMFHDFFYPFRTLWRQGEYLSLTLSSGLLVWSFLGALLIFFSGRSWLRKLTLPIFLFFFLFNFGSYQISNAPIDFQQTAMIVENFQWWIWEVIENYGLAALPFVLLLVPVIILVERLPDVLHTDLSRHFYLVPLSALILTTLGLQHTHGFFDRYPSFFRIPSMLVFAGQSRIYQGERSAAVYAESTDPGIEKIVLIVDESIRADILGINGFEKDTTPYLRSLQGGMVNFGLAASSSNCSDYANLVLRTGVQKQQIPDQAQVSMKQPSIWQWTRKAGFDNVYLDAQSAEEWANYQNFMNAHEASFIDEFARLRQAVAYESDGVALEKLVDHLKQPGRTFVLLNKYGMHFPYFRSHPGDYSFFSPALEQGEPMNDRERSLNSFMNGLRWSVDDWFKKLLSASEDFRPYVFIYTSDHGQNIVDDGSLATHCRPRANRFEGLVPMVIFSNNDDILEPFRTALANGHNKTSHFQIFPTLLELAGYDAAWVKRHYGASLSEAPQTQPVFFVGDLHGRGSIRRWISIFPGQTELSSEP